GLLQICEVLNLEPDDTQQRALDVLIGEGFDVQTHLLPAAHEARERGATVNSLKYLPNRATELKSLDKVNVHSYTHDAYTNDEEWGKRIRACITVAKRENAKPVQCWHDEWGPPPGQPGCVVPKAVIEKLLPAWEAE